MNDLRVGFVGLGDMGGAIATRLIAAGLPVTLWARRPESLRQFEPGQFRAADSLTELGQHSDVAGICVFGDADVRQVVLGPDGILSGLSAGSILLIHSTVSVATCRDIATEAAKVGVEVLDAPVTGARARALAGELVVLLGGDVEAVDRARPMLAAFASTTAHLGPLGSGQRMKALNNALGNATGRLAGLAVEVGVQLGLDVRWVIEVLRSGSASSAPMSSMVDRLMRDPEFADLASRMIVKDTALFREMCAEAGVAPGALEELAAQRAEHIVPMLAPRSAQAELIEAQRKLQDTIAGAAVPTEAAHRIAADLRSITMAVAEYQVPESHRRDGRRPELPGRGMPFMPPYLLDEQGPDFTKGRVQFTRFYLGGRGAAHGGAHAVLFDDIMGRLAARASGDSPTRTASLTINYRRIIPTDTDVAFDARIDRTEGRKQFVSARLYDETGEVGADCEGLFIVLRPDQQ